MPSRSGRRLIRYLGPLLVLVSAWAVQSPVEATFPGANGDIFFVEWDGFDYEVFRVSPSGPAAPTQVTDDDTDDSDPALSSSGRRIAFSRETPSGVDQIFVMRLGGGEPRRITRGSQRALDPTWTPDGNRIVFARQNSEGFFELYKVRVGPEPRFGRAITDSDRHDIAPEVSADGEWVVFLYTISKGDSEIVKIRMDGTGRRRLTNTAERIEHNPTWAPGGNRIAFHTTRPDGEPTVIASIRADGSHRRIIAEHDEFDLAHPTWSPNGERIAATVFGKTDTKIVRFPSDDGTPLRNVTTFEEGGTNPVWQPQP